MSDLRVETMTITPKKAEQMLSANTRNRPIKKTVVERLTGAIERGEWRLNGETIKFNGADLIDGQHRLLAVVAAQKAIETVVVFGLPTEAQETVDTGVKRSLADILALRGEHDTAALAGAVVLLWREQTNQEKVTGGLAYPTMQQALGILEANPGIREPTTKLLRRLGISDSVARYLNFRFTSLDADDADYFFAHLVSGAGLDTGNPILVLRQSLERDLVSSRPMSPVTRRAVIIKAWNAFRQGEKIQMIYWRPGGSRPEVFPKPI